MRTSKVRVSSKVRFRTIGISKLKGLCKDDGMPSSDVTVSVVKFLVQRPETGRRRA